MTFQRFRLNQKKGRKAVLRFRVTQIAPSQVEIQDACDIALAASVDPAERDRMDQENPNPLPVGFFGQQHTVKELREALARRVVPTEVHNPETFEYVLSLTPIFLFDRYYCGLPDDVDQEGDWDVFSSMGIVGVWFRLVVSSEKEKELQVADERNVALLFDRNFFFASLFHNFLGGASGPPSTSTTPAIIGSISHQTDDK